jgi:hypothetical protein
MRHSEKVTEALKALEQVAQAIDEEAPTMLNRFTAQAIVNAMSALDAVLVLLNDDAA